MDFAGDRKAGRPGQAVLRGPGLRAREAVQRPPRRAAAQLRRTRRALAGRRRHRRAPDVAPARPAGSPGVGRPHPRPRGPAPDEAPDLGDQPARTSATSSACSPTTPIAGRRDGRTRSTAAAILALVRDRLGLLPHGRAQPAARGRPGGASAAAPAPRTTVDAQVDGPARRDRGRPRSRWAGRRGRGSASGCAGTRRPRRSATRRRASLRPTPAQAASTPRRVERLAPVVDRRDAGRRRTSSSSCSNGGMTSRMRAISSTPPSPERVEDPVGLDPPDGVALRRERPVVVALRRRTAGAGRPARPGPAPRSQA